MTEWYGLHLDALDWQTFKYKLVSDHVDKTRKPVAVCHRLMF